MRARQYVVDEGREEAGVVPPGGVLLLIMPWTQPRAEGHVVSWAFPTGEVVQQEQLTLTVTCGDKGEANCKLTCKLTKVQL